MDQSAQTRFANDQKDAKASTILGSTGPMPQFNRQQQPIRRSQLPQRQLPPVGNPSQGATTPMPAAPIGAQPIGQLGERIKKQAAQRMLQQQVQQNPNPVEHEANIEEFASSTALQEVVQRAKLAEFFNRYGVQDEERPLSRVLEYLGRY